MLRKATLAATALLLALSGAGSAAPTPLASGTVQPGAAVCGGPAFDRILVANHPQGGVCVHHAPDAFSVERAGQGVAAQQPPTSPPVCYADGQTGPRVQIVYGYLEGTPNRAATMVPYVNKLMAPRMQAMIKAASGGLDLGMRFAFDKGCKNVSVLVVKFPRSVQAAPDGTNAFTQFGRMIDHLISLGHDRNDRKYHILWDGWNGAGVCGLGQAGAPDLPHPAQVQNGTPTVGGYTDPASTLLRPAGRSNATMQYSTVWGHVFGPQGPSCFELDQSKVGGQVHELFHSLGAVSAGAPHSDGGGHCTDKPSIMCAGPGIKVCERNPVQTLDCGQDDFWNPNPAPGTYLYSHNNIAKSQYFGPQPQDRLVGSPL